MSCENWPEIRRGAEASVRETTLFGIPVVAKCQTKKEWRVPTLDTALRSTRLQNEARSNYKCVRLGIPVAPIYFIDKENSIIYLQRLTGPTLKHYLLANPDDSSEELLGHLRTVGKIIAMLHDNEIIHSDLTTSNFMLHNNEVRVIDFGLSSISGLAEDKAVDLYVMERAFHSSHPGRQHLTQVILDAYTEASPKSKMVMNRLEKVRARGRKRSMVG